MLLLFPVPLLQYCCLKQLFIMMLICFQQKFFVLPLCLFCLVFHYSLKSFQHLTDICNSLVINQSKICCLVSTVSNFNLLKQVSQNDFLRVPQIYHILWKMDGPQSPDLTPADFFLWGWMKSFVYSARIGTQEELRHA